MKSKKIIPLEDKEQYVYDLQTKNNHFNGGIGSLIISNSDGIHISSLLLNLFHSLFPSLLIRNPSFIISMQTPIVRVFLQKTEKLFYNEKDFKDYIKSNASKNLKFKYYKGLGTSSDKEIKQTFGKKIISFVKDEDTDKTVEKTFSSLCSDERKEWLTCYDPDKIGSYVGNEEGCSDISITHFLDSELIKFSLDNCERSLPNVLDGLKQSQRKILYTCFQRKLNYTGKTLKVAQLAGSVAEKTNYHHGEQCLYETITKMAQEFPGANNIPLLFRDGQFGSKISGGKDAASARYIFTKLDRLTRLIFHPEDDVLLENVVDDGEMVEPKHYIPIIPMILVNGSAGIGTGWSCNIPSYNPLDLIKCIKIWLTNKSLNKKENIYIYLKPWYRGFTGQIDEDEEDDNKYITYGNLYKEKKTKKTIVDELPIGVWTDKFKEYLEELVEHKIISSFNNYSTSKKPFFEIMEMRGQPSSIKLYSYIRTSNMVLFVDNHKLKKFDNIETIIDHFCEIRFEYYIKRKAYKLKAYNNELKTIRNKRNFLEEVMNDTLIIKHRSEDDIIKDLETKQFDKEEESYNYLLKMPIKNFTQQKLDKLDNEINKIEIDIKTLKNTTENELWIKDLDEFEKEYHSYIKELDKNMNSK